MKNNFLKVLSVLLIALSAVLCLSSYSCGKDDNNNSPSPFDAKLVGKWQLIEIQIDGKLEDPNSPDAYYEPCEYGYLLFNKDGSCESFDSCEGVSIGINKGEWELKGKNLVLLGSNFPITFNFRVEELTDDKLVLSLTFLDKEKRTYKKIK